MDPGGHAGRALVVGVGVRLLQGRLLLDDAPPRHSCKPSVDVLLAMVGRSW